MHRKKKKKNEEHGVDESWLLPYSDMLTLLLALFIVLFAMSEIDSEKYRELSIVFQEEFTGGSGILENEGPPTDSNESEKLPNTDEVEEENDTGIGNQETERLESMQNKINAYITENNLSHVLQTSLSDEGLLISIFNDVYFDLGSAVVKGEGQKIAREMSKFLNTNPPHQIVVSGHTDNIPIENSQYDSNWELSAHRALNFMSLLLENNELDPKFFSAKGFGEHNPVAPNNSNKNRAKNRRVEVLILPN